MEDYTMTIDERIELHEKCLAEFENQLKMDLTTEARDILENNKKEEGHKLYILKEKKRKLLEKPHFLLLIANDATNKVIKTLPTYIETADEAKRNVVSIIDKVLTDNNVQLSLGHYLGIIVRKAFYDKMDDKLTVRAIFSNQDVHISSEEFVVTDKGIVFP